MISTKSGNESLFHHKSLADCAIGSACIKHVYTCRWIFNIYSLLSQGGRMCNYSAANGIVDVIDKIGEGDWIFKQSVAGLG